MDSNIVVQTFWTLGVRTTFDSARSSWRSMLMETNRATSSASSLRWSIDILWGSWDLIDNIDTSSTSTRRGEVGLKDIYKTFLIYRTCMRRAPAKPVRAALCESGVLFHMSHLKLHFALHTSHCALHTPHCTLHTPTLLTSHCTLPNPHFTLHCTLPTAHSTLHTSHSTLHTALFTLHTSSHLSSSHLIPAHLFSSHLFSYVI